MVAILALAVLIAAGASLYARQFFLRYRREREEHAKVRSLFSRYVPGPVVEELLARRDPRLFEARHYYATILCARIRNFPLLAERLDPEQTLRYLNEFYAIIAQCVDRHHGMVESLRGEAATGVFGVLREETFQEERALRAALDIIRIVKTMEARWTAQGRKPLDVCIGVNSGKIVAGDAGSPTRREFAIVGNPAHVAERLVQTADEINAAIVVSAATFDPVRELFVGVPLSALPLRGLRRLHKTYVLRGLSKRTADEDLLTVPGEREIARTVVLPEPPPEPAVEPDAYLAPEAAADEVRREFAAPVELHPEPGVVVDDFGVPEVHRISRMDDERPALPEPPPLPETYEDDEGPPVTLPP
jgi:class 3 adenylate cyclase